MPDKIENSQLNSFSDLGCAAALISAGFELAFLNKENPQRVLFVFKHSVDIDQTINDYFSGRLMTNARIFFDTTRALKHRIFNE